MPNIKARLLIVATIATLSPSVATAGQDTPQSLARDAASTRLEVKRDYAEVDRILAQLADPRVQAEVIRIGRSTKSAARVQAYLNQTIRPRYALNVTSLDTDFCLIIDGIKTKWFTVKKIVIGSTGKCKK